VAGFECVEFVASPLATHATLVRAGSAGPQ